MPSGLQEDRLRGLMAMHSLDCVVAESDGRLVATCDVRLTNTIDVRLGTAYVQCILVVYITRQQKCSPGIWTRQQRGKLGIGMLTST